MALGVQVLGSAAIVLIGLTSTPTTPVGGLVNWNYPDTIPTTTRYYFGQASSIAVGKQARTITLTCDYESGDAGQLILQAAVVAGTPLWCMIKPDGTNGETLPCRVTGRDIAGPDVNQYITTNFTLSQITDPAVVAGGFGT